MHNFSYAREPFILQVFGATGHLATSKLYPALAALAEQKRFPSSYLILGYGRSALSVEAFREHVRAACASIPTDILEEFLSHISYQQGNYDSEKDMQACNAHIAKWFPTEIPTRIAYFAVPPKAFQDIITTLARTKRTPEEDIRLIIEKPFGEDARSAEALYQVLSAEFPMSHCYLLDHYLGKTAVQSILHLRHKNRILDVLLRSEHIAGIQITASEHDGILNRAPYYEGMGATKDMLQSHLIQLLALTTMAIPVSKDARSIQQARAKILESLYISPEKSQFIRGQYASYQSESGVALNSSTDTYAAAVVFFNQEQWHNIPIFLRTGKKLADKRTEIVVEFKKFSFQEANELPNRLIFKIHPEEALTLTLENQYNSFDEQTLSTNASSSIACIGDDCLPEHSRLLLKVLEGDQTYFLSFPEIIAGWKFIEQLHTVATPIISYEDHSDGPKEASELPQRFGQRWWTK